MDAFMDSKGYERGPVWRHVNWWGLAFVVGGVWWLAHEIWDVPFQWAWIGPFALVVVGLSMLSNRGWYCGPEHGRRRDPDDRDRT